MFPRPEIKRDNLDSQVQEETPKNYKATVQMLNFHGFPPGAWAALGPLRNIGTPPPLPDFLTWSGPETVPDGSSSLRTGLGQMLPSLVDAG